MPTKQDVLVYAFSSVVSVSICIFGMVFFHTMMAQPVQAETCGTVPCSWETSEPPAPTPWPDCPTPYPGEPEIACDPFPVEPIVTGPVAEVTPEVTPTPTPEGVICPTRTPEGEQTCGVSIKLDKYVYMPAIGAAPDAWHDADPVSR